MENELLNSSSVGLTVLPSHLSDFSHGGYTTNDEYNVILSDYCKSLIKIYDLLVNSQGGRINFNCF